MPDLETLTATAVPEQDVAVKSQALAAQELHSDVGTETTQGYTYTRADGTVEHAANAEEARKACPVLGKMSVGQANVMLELAAIGKEKMAQEAAKRPEPQEPKRAETAKPEKTVKHDEAEHPIMVEPLGKPVVVQPEKHSLAAALEHTIRQQELAAVEPGATIDVRNAIKELPTPLAAEIEPKPILPEQPLDKVADLLRVQTVFTNVDVAEIQIRESVLADEILNHLSIGLAPAPKYIPDQARPEPALDSGLDKAPSTQVNITYTEQFSTIFEPKSSETGLLELEGFDEELALPAIDAVLDLDYLAETSELAPMPENGLMETPNRMELQEVVAINWEAALSKEPLELYDNFVEALQIFAELPTAPLVSEQGDNLEVVDPESTLIVTEQEIQPTPPIITAVTERLVELELADKELAIPIIQEIVEAVHDVELLEVQAADPEAIEIAETQLAELCIALFEAIGIEYDEQDIEQFMQVVLRPDFQPSLPVEQEVIDLEHVGTREAKYSLPNLASSLTNVEYKLERLLGFFVLLRTSVTAQGA